MRTTIELSEQDIKEIIAKHFNTTPDRVTVGVEKVCVGYGMAEHEEAVPVIKVTKEEKTGV